MVICFQVMVICFLCLDTDGCLTIYYCLCPILAVINRLKRRLDEDYNSEDNSNDVVAENEEAISDELAHALQKVKRIVRMYTA